jgi:hypothetical protein
VDTGTSVLIREDDFLRPPIGTNTAWYIPPNRSLDGDPMLVTLVALLCNGQVCLEKVVTDSEQSSISMMDCQVHAQAGIAEWLQNGPYRTWHLESYKCILGKYTPKRQA